MSPRSPFDALELCDFTVWACRVECTLTVDEPAKERAYRVAADYDVEHDCFSRVRVLGVWDTELDEQALSDHVLSAAIARWLECTPELDWLHDKLHDVHGEHWSDVAVYERLDERGEL